MPGSGHIAHSTHHRSENSISFQNQISKADRNSNQIIHDTDKIIQNILLGYCPIELERVYVFVQHTREIDAMGAITLLCNFDTPEAIENGTVVTPDAEVLSRVCSSNDVDRKIGNELKEIRDSEEFSSLEKAVPAIVALAVEREHCSVEDAERMTRKYSVWLKGCKWSDCDYPVSDKPC